MVFMDQITCVNYWYVHLPYLVTNQWLFVTALLENINVCTLQKTISSDDKCSYHDQ